ncbi:MULTISPECIES: SH3 domain-containing protein [Anaerolinea]|uniref:SH3 domain-containing protein n=1 Tax=Anaerolinea TaxID=233189 RepID=UPI0026311781|nr:SH3 domain-containing protein [Anaerolinea thermophila]
MTLPASEPIPLPEEELPPARRRRLRRMVIPERHDEQSAFLDALGERTTPGAEFFLSALLAGLVTGIALLLDSPALVVLAALLAPFMAPVLGMGVAGVAGSTGFLLRSLVSTLIGGLIFFLTGTLTGIPARLLALNGWVQLSYLLRLDGYSLLLLSLGTILSTVLLVRSTQQRPLVSSVAMAYALFLPLGAAGYGLTSGAPLPWYNGMVVFFIGLAVAALLGAVTLVIQGLRPLNGWSYLFTGAYMTVVVAALVIWLSGGIPVIQLPEMTAPQAPQASAPPSVNEQVTSTPAGALATPTLTATATVTGTATPTRTLIPTNTPTMTVTPQPTPVWARINVKGSNGAVIRAEPGYNAAIVKSLLNGIIVEVLNDVATADGATWVKIRTADGVEGWIVRALLATATPAPGW